jgi:uncharacterized protein (DUF362 family)/Pyruvate/2-oxoacid:ferredoxin oxidoreductase delta subunit
MQKEVYLVSSVKCKSYSQNEVDLAVLKSINLIGGIKKYIKKGDKVLIKVNAVGSHSPDQAATTHPALVKAIIKLVKKQKAFTFIGDDPAGLAKIKQVSKATGFEKISKETKTPIVEFINPVIYKDPKGKIIKQFKLSGKIKQFDVIINVPKLKTHLLTLYTGAIKNLYGFISGMEKAKYHYRFPDKYLFTDLLLDLYLLLKPQLTIMDAITCMEGNGPVGGDKVNFGLILASNDSLALDTVALNFIKLYNQAPLIKVAKKRKFPQSNLKNIQFYGIKKYKKFKKPRSHYFGILGIFLTKFRNLISAKPYVNERLCISCGTCANFCPAKAIKIKNKLPNFDYKKCIRCYCCNEICPQRAIYLKKPLLLRWF